MSKQNKKVEPKKEPKKEKAQEETQESKLAKKIIDLEVEISNKNKELEDANSKINLLKSELEKMAEEYKSLISQAEIKANEIIKKKIDENDNKFKTNLAEAKKYAIEDQAIELIDIVSKFSVAVNHPIEDPKIANWLNGFKMYLTMFNNLLNDLNIKQISVQIGQEFDANVMECFETVVDQSKPNNSVISIIEPGYKLHDHILKPCLVRVVKNN